MDCTSTNGLEEKISYNTDSINITATRYSILDVQIAMTGVSLRSYKLPYKQNRIPGMVVVIEY